MSATDRMSDLPDPEPIVPEHQPDPIELPDPPIEPDPPVEQPEDVLSSS